MGKEERMEELISIVIPVYNVENYLPACIQSVLTQTYQNLEIILVDDGSSDQSGALCDEFAFQDRRIKVFHQKNRGLSAARNAGLEEISGGLVSFIDSDDQVAPDYIETLYALQEKYQADIVCCDYEAFLEGTSPVVKAEAERILEMDANEALMQYFGSLATQTTVAWGKLYDKKLFLKIRFPEGRLHEDEFTTYRLLADSGKIVYTNQKLYFYLQRKSSITGVRFQLRHLDALDALEERCRFFQDRQLFKLYEKTAVRLLDYLVKDYYLVGICYPEEKEIQRKLLERFRIVYREQRKHGFSKKTALFWMFLHFPGAAKGLIFKKYGLDCQSLGKGNLK